MKDQEEKVNQNIEIVEEAQIQSTEQNVDSAKDQEEVVKLRDQILVLEDKLFRSLAEADNMRKRYDKMLEEARDYSVTSFAKDLLVVMDNLSRALEHRPTEPNVQVANILTGVEMTKNQLVSIFKVRGLEPIEPIIGDKFDYNIHHATAQLIHDEYDADCILGVMQIGYKIKDRLLRPAMVSISKK
jgi:molecular chaperone GrpE